MRGYSLQELQEPHFKNIVLQAAMLFALSRSVNALEGNVKCSVILPFQSFPNSVPVKFTAPLPLFTGLSQALFLIPQNVKCQ